ncbi:MAG: PEP-CTERM sorting domain-containing protein [Pseudomonadota bacterium]|nr:PEP-CTERM sorting domain-containing protein [Pseudomonadota bacterium]
MKRIFLQVTVLFTALALFAGLANATPFTYDTDNQGWQQSYIGRPSGSTYDTLYPRQAADWTDTEGNPAGSIFQTADGINQRAYWLGYIEDNSLGDLTGMRLQTDIRSTNNWQTIANGASGDDGNVYARWVIANDVSTGTETSYNMFISNRAASIDVNQLNGWETHSVALEESNFLRWPNYDADTQTFADLLSDYDSIGLYLFSGTDTISNIDGGTGTWDNNRLLHYGAYNDSGTATWGLDNFQAAPVPEPATILLLGIGLLGLVGYSRKRKKS